MMDHKQQENAPVTVVLVGIGGYGALYVDELLKDCDAGLCRLVGVVDLAAKASAKYAQITERNIPVFDTLDAFYHECRAQLCCIAAPIQFHTPYSACALEHGSCVLCEKPLSGEWTDGIALEALAEKHNLFIMSGYQWSYSDAIIALKKDILSGTFGAPKHLRTKVLWPRRYSYFHRGSGWAGKRYAEDGTAIFDSVANNAAAHYLHNMLFILGDSINTAALPESMDAELLRANPIENFDTCVLRMHMHGGADALFIATHSTAENENPEFVYEFENGTVCYSQKNQAEIVAVMKDGSRKEYGDPFADQMNKVRYAIQAVKHEDTKNNLFCTARTAIPHARCIHAIRDVPIVDVPDALLEILPGEPDRNDTLRVVRHLHRALNLCYTERSLISELSDAEIEPLKTCLHPVTDIRMDG